MKRVLMAMIAGSMVALIGITAPAAMAAPQAPAIARVPMSNGWGWGQLDFNDMPQWQSDAVRDALIAATANGVTQARKDALAPLVASKVLTQAQADLIASVNNASVIAALTKSGQITKAQAVVIRKALAGTNGVLAKRAAARIALDSLVKSNVITQAQADAVKAALGL